MRDGGSTARKGYVTSVAAAIEYYNSQGAVEQIKEYIPGTIKLVKTMNDIFDDINSKYLNDSTSFRKPIIRGESSKPERLRGYLKF